MIRSSRIQLILTVLISGLPLTAGCASIISGRHANVAIETYPTNAHVTISDKQGRQVASVNTPAVVSLDRNGKWFLPARYTATIEAPGYQTTQVPIRSTINPWILGNVVVGGVPGLIVDNATGACWKPQQDTIHQDLAPMAYAQQPQTPGAQPVALSSTQMPNAPTAATVPTGGGGNVAGGTIQASTAIPSATNQTSVARGPSGSYPGTLYR
jgi:hypothetical protein